MNWIKKLIVRRSLSDELSQEMRSHLEERTRALVESGLSAREAELAARREFGNGTRLEESGRDVWRCLTLDSYVGDLRHSVRQLRRIPGFSCVVVLMLGLGIGANAAIFSWTRTVLLNPLPGVADASRIVALEMLTPSGQWVPSSYPDFRELRDKSKLVEAMAATYPMGLAVGNDGDVERIWGELVSGNYFSVLRVQPERGRFFTAAESDDAQNVHPVVVLSHSLWVSRYQANPDVIGTTIRISHYPFTVIGIAPPAFHGSMPGLDFEMWTPVTMYGRLNSAGEWMLQDRKARMLRIVGRLAPGTAIEQAREEVRAIASRLAEAHADTNQGMSATLQEMWKAHDGVQESLRAPLGILLGVSGVVLLIVCANVANLLLSQVTRRRKEFGIRLALGAPKTRLVRQMLTETSLLAAGGGLLGLVLAYWLNGALAWLLPASAFPTLLRPPLDSGVLLYSLLLTFVVAILAGITPAFFATRESVDTCLRETGRNSTPGRQSQRARGILATCEMTLAVVAVVGAGLFLKSFLLTQAARPGFDATHVGLGRFSLSTSGYNAEQADAFCQRLRQAIEHQPGITAVSYADFVPMSIGGDSWEDLQIEGYAPGPSESMKIFRTVVAPGYFDLMKIPILRGRDFRLSDAAKHDRSCAGTGVGCSESPVMIVNQEFVRKYLRNEYAIGRKVRGWGEWFTIVGVVQDSKYFHLTENPIPYFYVPMRQIYRPEYTLSFFVRTAGPAGDAIAALRRETQQVGSAAPMFESISLEDFIYRSLFQEKISADLLTALASVAFLLAAAGLYSVMAHWVAQRTREISIRVVMGAQRVDVLRAVGKPAMRIVSVGLVLGLAVAAGLARFVSAMLYSVRAGDPAIYAGAALATLVTAVCALGIPAWRAMHVDPIIALRDE